MINYVVGNLLNANEDIIVQQVNCMGVMGAGLAKQIRTKYPQVYNEYVSFVQEHGSANVLGKCNLVKLTNKYVCNIFGQFGYGTSKQQTNYNALRTALTTLCRNASKHNKSIAIPYGLGCGLAGGDWNIVLDIITQVFSDYSVTIYKF